MCKDEFEYTCNWHGECDDEPYVEIYPYTEDGEFVGTWSYLCKGHFIQALLDSYRGMSYKFAYVETDEGVYEECMKDFKDKTC